MLILIVVGGCALAVPALVVRHWKARLATTAP